MAFPKVDDIIESIKSDIGNPLEGDSAPDTSQEVQAGSGAPIDGKPEQSPETQEQVAAQKALDLAELVKDQKFKLGDDEWTLSDLQKSIMRQRDYTKKTQEISKLKKEYEETVGDRKYFEALVHDLKKVEQNPKLISEFKSVYPEKFHQYIAHLEQEATLDPISIKEMIKQEIKSAINPLEESLTNKEAESIAAKYEAWDKEFGDKYKYANINLVYSILDQAKAQGLPMDQKSTWEQAWKTSHDQMQEHFNKLRQSEFAEKKQLNQAAKDVRPGGAIPGQAPEKFGLKDSARKMLEFMSAAKAQ